MTAHSSREVIETKIVDGIATLRVCRSEALNALSPDVLQSLILAFERLIMRRGTPAESIGAVVIEGEGDKAFVAGADIRSMADLGPRAIADYAELGQRALRTIERYPAPVIAAVHGYALGGGLELALACDLIVASKGATFGQPEVNLGILPGFGGTQRLITRCGVGTARYLCLTGEVINGEEAHRRGLVDLLVEEDARGEARLLALKIASKGPLATRAVKKVIKFTEQSVISSGLRGEVEAFLEVFGSSDREEGMRAFLERRQPKFTGA